MELGTQHAPCTATSSRRLTWVRRLPGTHNTLRRELHSTFDLIVATYIATIIIIRMQVMGFAWGGKNEKFP